MKVMPFGCDVYNDKKKKIGFSLIGFYADIEELDKKEAVA